MTWMKLLMHRGFLSIGGDGGGGAVFCDWRKAVRVCDELDFNLREIGSYVNDI
jgi:hypothetical protein